MLIALRSLVEDSGAGIVQIATTPLDVGHPSRQKWRQELVDLLARPLPDIKISAKAKKAIQRVLDKAPPDDTEAVKALRRELGRLRVPYKPAHVQALRYVQAKRVEAARQYDDEDEELLLLH